MKKKRRQSKVWARKGETQSSKQTTRHLEEVKQGPLLSSSSSRLPPSTAGVHQKDARREERGWPGDNNGPAASEAG